MDGREEGRLFYFRVFYKSEIITWTLELYVTFYLTQESQCVCVCVSCVRAYDTDNHIQTHMERQIERTGLPGPRDSLGCGTFTAKPRPGPGMSGGWSPVEVLPGTESDVGWCDLEDFRCEVSGRHLWPFVHVPFKRNPYVNHDYQYFIILAFSAPSLHFAGEL